MENHPWARRVIRSVGIANIIFAVTGLWLLIGTVARFLKVHAPNPASAPYSNQVFEIMATANLWFLVLLAFAGLRLVQLRFGAIRVCNFVFAAEIIYFLAIAFLEGAARLSQPVLLSIGKASGAGNMGIAPQILTGYPIIALVLLNVAKHRLAGRKPAIET